MEVFADGHSVLLTVVSKSEREPSLSKGEVSQMVTKIFKPLWIVF